MLTVTTPLDEADAYRYAHLVSQSLGLPLDRVPAWTQAVGGSNMRLIYADDAVVGGLPFCPSPSGSAARPCPWRGSPPWRWPRSIGAAVWAPG